MVLKAVKEETWPEGPDRSGLIPEVEGARVTATEIASRAWNSGCGSTVKPPCALCRIQTNVSGLAGSLTASGMYVEWAPGNDGCLRAPTYLLNAIDRGRSNPQRSVRAPRDRVRPGRDRNRRFAATWARSLPTSSPRGAMRSRMPSRTSG
jgi:hypothetical protein